MRDYKQDTKDEGKLQDETIFCEILDLPIEMIELTFCEIILIADKLSCASHALVPCTNVTLTTADVLRSSWQKFALVAELT